MPNIIVVMAVVVGFCGLGLYQKRWEHLRSAVIFGLLGPLPGALLNLAVPRHGGFAAQSVFSWQFLVLAVMMMGPYCFAVGLAGSWLIARASRPELPRWARPATIVATTAVAAMPVVLLEGSPFTGLGLDAVVSAAFWCVAVLVFGVPGMRRSASGSSEGGS